MMLSMWKIYLCFPLFFIFSMLCDVQEATELLKDGIDLIPEADTALSNLLSYPLHSTLSRYCNFKMDFCFSIKRLPKVCPHMT